MAGEAAGIAWLFPGQGAQRVGMGQDVAEEFPEARAVFEAADAALERPLSEIIFHGPEEELVRTVNTQPAILATSLACLAAAQATGDVLRESPSFMAGHSLGEYSALVAAGALSFAAGIRLVQERGRLMQEACDANPSTMAALIGLDESAVAAVCTASGAEICNINTGNQIVVGGRHTAVAAAVEAAKAAGARRAIPLKVGGAFHSSLMRAAAEGMVAALEAVDFAPPATPVVGNVQAAALTAADEVQADLRAQVSSPVRWRQSVELMLAGGVRRFVEIGPGSALTGMVKTIVKEEGAKAEGAKAEGAKAEGPELLNLNDVASIRGGS